MAVHSLKVKGVGIVRRRRGPAIAENNGHVEFVTVNSHGLGKVERGKIRRWNGGVELAEIQVIIGQPGIFRTEHEADAVIRHKGQRPDFFHDRARGLHSHALFPLPGRGGDNKVVGTCSLGGRFYTAHAGNQMAGVVGGHFQHPFPIRFSA